MKGGKMEHVVLPSLCLLLLSSCLATAASPSIALSTFQQKDIYPAVFETASPAPTEDPKRHRRDSPLGVSSDTWVWVPIVVIGIYGASLVAHVKFVRLDKKSLRLWLMRYISLEALYNTLAGADHHKIIEERNIEIGHQVFHFLAWLLLLINFVLNSDGLRWMFYVLAVTQIGLWGFQLIIDNILIWKGGIRSVRSVNTKLRFAQCTYQVVLFCTDVISGGIVQLPVDCYIWATAHYAYEGFGLLLEGLNVIGLSDLAIATLMNVKAVQAADRTPPIGAVCAFGITCLVLSCASIVGGALVKFIDAKKYIVAAHDPPLEVHLQETETHTVGNEMTPIPSLRHE